MSDPVINPDEQQVTTNILPAIQQPGRNQISSNNVPSVGGLTDRIMSDVFGNEGSEESRKQRELEKIAKWRRKCKFMIEEEERLKKEKEQMEYNKLNILFQLNYKIQKRYSKLKGYYLYDIPFEFIKAIVMFWILINFK